MATAFRYIRCSHTDSAESGLGLTSQEQTCSAYFDLLRLRNPALRDLRLDPHLYADIAVSAYQQKTAAFNKRPQGRLLLTKVSPGDHIIFARLDRSFRRAVECRRWVDHWMKTGVTVHFVDLQIDTSTSHGILIMGIMSYFAEWQSAYISERTKEGLKQKILRDGKVHDAGIAEILTVTESGERIVTKDHKRQLRIRYIRWMKDVVSARVQQERGKPFTNWEIIAHLDRCEARREKREPSRSRSRMPLTDRELLREYHAAPSLWPDRYMPRNTRHVNRRRIDRTSANEA